jgi:hypothetical protein
MMSSGARSAPIFFGDVLRSSSPSSRDLASCAPFSVTNATIAWPLISCGLPDDRGLGDGGVIDERALDLHRADAVAGDVHHVVDAAEQPEVAVVVELGAVAGEVDAGYFDQYCFT